MAKMKILGMKASKGDFEGTSFDKTTVFVETRLDDSKGTMKGYASAEYAFGTSVEFEKFKHLPFPFFADCETELVTTGKMQKTIMLSCVPIQQAKA